MSDRLYRSTDDRVIAGVCGGLADRMDLDPSLVRVGYALVALLTAFVPLLVLYVIMAMVVPEEPDWGGVRPVDPFGPPAWGPGGPPSWGPGPASPAPPTSPGGATGPTTGAGVAGAGNPGFGPDPSIGAGPTPPSTGPIPGWTDPATDWTNTGGWRTDRVAGRHAAREARRAAREARRAGRHGDPLPAMLAGLLLVGLGAFLLLRNTIEIDWSVVWPAAILGVGVLVVIAAFVPRSRD